MENFNSKLERLGYPTPDEAIEYRVGTQFLKFGKYPSVMMLAYKDARHDMNTLDAVVGPAGWTRSHQLIDGQLMCSIGIYNEQGVLVTKQDVGTESNTEREKGRASDSLKRAGVNWGIGRDLYSFSEFDTDVSLMEGEYTMSGNKPNVKSWILKEMTYKVKRAVDGHPVGLYVTHKGSKSGETVRCDSINESHVVQLTPYLKAQIKDILSGDKDALELFRSRVSTSFKYSYEAKKALAEVSTYIKSLNSNK